MDKGMIVSPTGKGIRNDGAGGGFYHAPRGDYLHKGIDFLCTPGQDIVCPIGDAQVIRHAYPYADLSYGGLLLQNAFFEILLFYFSPSEAIFDQTISRGGIIGIAQDISKRYNSSKMHPHIHLEIKSVDPALFMQTNKEE